MKVEARTAGGVGGQVLPCDPVSRVTKRKERNSKSRANVLCTMVYLLRKMGQRKKMYPTMPYTYVALPGHRLYYIRDKRTTMHGKDAPPKETRQANEMPLMCWLKKRRT